MMSKNLKSLRPGLARYFAHHSAAAPKSSSNPGEVKTSTLPSGMVLASVQSDCPLARIGVVIRAGSRYEPADQIGLTHTLRSAAGFTTKNFTGFGITRNIEYFGGRLSVAGTRDTISYMLESHNDEEIVAKNFSILGDTVSSPEFKQWEISDNIERIEADLSILADTPHIQLAEALHAVSFRGGLRKSLYTPKHMIGKHNSDALKAYVKERFVGPNTVVVGVGIEHEELVAMVGQHFTLPSHQAAKCKSKFIGGEVHLDSASPLTYVALATEGAGLKSGKDVIALQLFQTILGSGPQIKHSNGVPQVTRLGRAIGGKSAEDVAISAFNFAYEDTGLFGINLIAPNRVDITATMKAAIKELRAAAGNVSDAELADAKKNLKTSMLMATEQGDALAIELGNQLLLRGGDITDLTQQIDSITSADVKTVAKKLLKSKLSLAVLGSNGPYLEDFVE